MKSKIFILFLIYSSKCVIAQQDSTSILSSKLKQELITITEASIQKQDSIDKSKASLISNGDIRKDTTGLNITSSFIDIKIFSDFVGIDQTKPNGLIQTELSGSLDLSITGNVLKNSKSSLKFIENIYPFFIYSRLDGKERIVRIRRDSVQNVNYVPIVSLIQYANVSTGGKVNLLTYSSREKSIRLYLDFLFRMYFTEGAYTRQIDNLSRTDTFNLTTVGYGTSLKLRVTPANFKNRVVVDFSMPILFEADLYDNDFKAGFGPEYRTVEAVNKSRYDGNSKGTRGWVIFPQFELIYTDLNKNKFFFRTSIISNNRNNVFTQFQIGYARQIDIGKAKISN